MSRRRIILPYGFKPRPHQKDFIAKVQKGSRYNIMLWSRRQGKDLTSFNTMIMQMLSRPGMYAYIYPKATQAERNLWFAHTGDGTRFLDYVPPQLLKKKPSLKEMMFTLEFNHNGKPAQSTCFVLGARDIDSLRGMNPIGTVISEYRDHHPDLYGEIVMPIIEENGGWVIINGTPKYYDHFYDLWNAAKENPSWNASRIQSLYPDQEGYWQTISQEAIKMERDRGVDENKLRREYGAEFIASEEGLIYGDCVEKARESGRVGEFAIDKNAWVDTFWDLGYDDACAVWFRVMEGNKVLWIDYVESNKQDFDYYVEVLKEKNYRYRTHYVPHDGKHRTQGPGKTKMEFLQEELEKARLSADVKDCPKPMHKAHLINASRARFYRYYFHMPATEMGLRKISAYHRDFDSRRKIYTDNPAHDSNSHAADAIALESEADDDWMDSDDNIYTQPIRQRILKSEDPLGGRSIWQ